MRIDTNYPWLVMNGQGCGSKDITTWQQPGALIYEVMRVIEGKPLFYSEHMARLETSAALLGHSLGPWLQAIHSDVDQLIEKNQIQQDNIKLVVGGLETGEPKWVMFGVKGFYPPASWYETGISSTLIWEERSNPHAKVVNAGLAEKLDQLRRTTAIFEALLVDQMGRITEGSRSNVFFIKGETLLMPRTDLALKGITRDKLLLIAEEMGISCVEADVYAANLSEVDGIFVTGTSIDLLPISKVDQQSFETCRLPLMQKLLSAYRTLMKASLNLYGQG